MKSSLQRFVTVLISAIFVCGTLSAAILWYSTRYSKEAIEILSDSVTSASLADAIQRNLSVHRRQALLKNLTTQTERFRRTEEAKGNLLRDLQALSDTASSNDENKIVLDIKTTVLTYLANYEALRSNGIRAGKLYESVSEDAYVAQEAIQELIKFNLDEARVLQAETKKQNRINYGLVTLSLLFLLVAFLTLLFGLRKNLYLPIIRLNTLIESFEIRENIDDHKLEGAPEVLSIWSIFKKLAAKLLKQKDTQLNFLSAIAHDLKNPLGAFKMSVELISEDKSISEESREIVAIMGRQTNHLMRLINDLLDTTRIESGHMALELSSCDIRLLIQDSAALHANLSKEHKIQVELPQYPIVVYCDQHRLTQVFNNLITNAIKYSPKGGQISVVLLSHQGNAQIEIADSGIGILANDLTGIFEPFRRSSSTRDSIPGIGLGLSVSKKIIRGHKGGDISVSSIPGKGTSFVITLPIEKNSASDLKTQELTK